MELNFKHLQKSRCFYYIKVISKNTYKTSNITVDSISKIAYNIIIEKPYLDNFISPQRSQA